MNLKVGASAAAEFPRETWLRSDRQIQPVGWGTRRGAAQRWPV